MASRTLRAVVSTMVGLAAAVAPFVSTPLASASTSPDTLSPPPRGAVRTSKPCRIGRYHAHPKLVTARSRPAVTHLSTYGMGPSVSHQVTRTARYQETVHSGWHFAGSADVSTSGLARLIAKVDIHFDGAYRKTTGHTTTRSVSVTDTIVNRTGHNVQYVFYSGVTHAYGRDRWYFCEQYYVNGQNYGPVLVTYYPGKWTTYTAPGSGALRCGAGRRGLGALARRALDMGCPN